MSRYDLYAPRYPLLPLKNVVIFPRNIVTLLVGRPRSIQAIEEAMARDRRIVVTAHRDSEIEEPRPEDLHTVGTLAELVQMERQQGNSVQVVLEGVSRVRLGQFDSARSFYTVAVDEPRESETSIAESRALMQHVQALAQDYAESRNKLSPEVLDMIQRASEPG